MDLGLRPRTVLAAKDPFKLRTKSRDPQRVAWLKSHTDLGPRELEWLGDGWSSPVAALRPAQLLARVQKVATHFGGDPDRRAPAAGGVISRAPARAGWARARRPRG